MRTIEVEEDVYKYILRHTEVIGEPASSILRRLLDLTPTSRPLEAANGTSTPDHDRELSDFLRSSRLLGARGATKRFLQILGFVHQQNPDTFEQALSFPTGRSRIYFARTEEEIARSGKSTHPKQIPGSPFWALTNTDTPQKRDQLSIILKTLGYDPSVVQEAVETID